ncbi:hypothetical protein BMT55_08210 [Listeria newyorkensis]|uniref:Uncharacterized protein n=1 Tax=Listeria newyorkensis TaxID=1497681 RepID=A0ABX4XMQ7_9LIST|nr:hypothetical protein [Listeria newyorkensis]PNP92542.1 hypothetical protein BMT55_08210 [Listeria newyorkensis]
MMEQQMGYEIERLTTIFMEQRLEDTLAKNELYQRYLKEEEQGEIDYLNLGISLTDEQRLIIANQVKIANEIQQEYARLAYESGYTDCLRLKQIMQT